ncbi:DEAD/DEAH box helicase domain [Dillenia turbinata]|uniref:DEAD/DEAH box helicase domain n=1 Tax=Dillenia turbinata TaxID=194707 RepID=A0AAN8ZVP6_9MAGN
MTKCIIELHDPLSLSGSNFTYWFIAFKLDVIASLCFFCFFLVIKQILVLDEADQILDVGFLKPLYKIISQLPKERQTLLFSATQEPVQDLARLSLKNPEYLGGALRGLESNSRSDLRQGKLPFHSPLVLEVLNGMLVGALALSGFLGFAVGGR